MTEYQTITAADTVLPAAPRDLAPLLLVPVLMLAMLPLVGSLPTWITLTVAGLAMGMMMVSPMTISLPFKLLLFVTLDGWLKISQGLLLSYK